MCTENPTALTVQVIYSYAEKGFTAQQYKAVLDTPELILFNLGDYTLPRRDSKTYHSDRGYHFSNW